MEAESVRQRRVLDTRALPAAVLSVGGLGAGYLYLRRWGAFVVYLLGLSLWLGIASSSPFWLVVLLAWAGWSVVRAWLLGREVPRPSRSRRTIWVPFAIGLVLAWFSAGLVLGFRAEAENLVAEGDNAHADGDCEAALDHYDRVTTVYKASFTAAVDEASARRRDCRRLLDARDAADDHDYPRAIPEYEAYIEDSGRPLFADGAADELAMVRADYAAELVQRGDESSYTEAYDQYVRIVADHPGSPAATSAPDAVLAMFDTASAQAGAQGRCVAAESLSFFAGFPGNDGLSDVVVARATEALPAAQVECENERIQEEIAVLQTRAEALPSPTPSGSAPGDVVTIEIVNGSREPLEVLYTGPATGRATLEACPDCAGGLSIDSGFADCGTPNSPRLALTLPGGTYQMVVKSTGTSVVPFYGSWDLVAGTAYSDCYYIVTSFG